MDDVTLAILGPDSAVVTGLPVAESGEHENDFNNTVSLRLHSCLICSLQCEVDKYEALSIAAIINNCVLGMFTYNVRT